MNGHATPVLVPTRGLLSGMRWMQAGLGLVCFGLGAIGAMVPGMPTTVFLLMGSWLLTRSCPALERRLRAMPLFANCTLLNPEAPFTPSARRAALVAMWTSILASSALLAWRGVPMWVVATVLASGVAGTVAIRRFRRHLPTAPAPR